MQCNGKKCKLTKNSKNFKFYENNKMEIMHVKGCSCMVGKFNFNRLTDNR